MRLIIVSALLFLLTSCGFQPVFTDMNSISSSFDRNSHGGSSAIMVSVDIIKYDYIYTSWTVVWDYKYGYVRDEWMSDLNDVCVVGDYKVYRSFDIPKVYDTKEECLNAR